MTPEQDNETSFPPPSSPEEEDGLRHVLETGEEPAGGEEPVRAPARKKRAAKKKRAPRKRSSSRTTRSRSDPAPLFPSTEVPEDSEEFRAALDRMLEHMPKSQKGAVAYVVQLLERHQEYVRWKTAAERLRRGQANWDEGRTIELCVREAMQRDELFLAYRNRESSSGRANEFNPASGSFDNI